MAITIDLGAKGGTVSPLWFGHNLEHTRSCMWGGLAAQLIQNRKFAGKPARTGESPGWYRVGPADTFIAPDEKAAFTAHHSPATRGRYDECMALVVQSCRDGVRSGVGQRDVALCGGRVYEFRLIARTDTRLAVTVAFTDAARGRVHGTRTWTFAPGDWRTEEFNFTAAMDDAALLEISFEGAGTLTLGAVSLLPAGHVQGMRAEVIDMLREIGTTILRWPGGNFAGDYRWQDGLMSADRRGSLQSFTPIETLPHSYGYDHHEVGTDEFMTLCRMIGAEPFLSINLGHEGPEEAAAWVEYCNGGPGTAWGRRRAERGFPEPYNVKYWSVGNEMGYGHMEGPNSAAEYAQKARACAEAMRAVDPSLVLIHSGLWHAENDWYRVALPKMADIVDCIADHYCTIPGITAYRGAEGLAQCRRAAAVPATVRERLKTIRALTDRFTPSGRRIGISFDEWNLWWAWYREPGVNEAIYTAGMLNLFVREAASFGMDIGCYFEPVNEGAILVTPAAARLTASG
ncbi:MAG: hypothetical protein ABIF71_05125 [Planctomycetota bacterium]